MTEPVCPECRAEKHGNCDGQAWSISWDRLVSCACEDESHTKV